MSYQINQNWNNAGQIWLWRGQYLLFPQIQSDAFQKYSRTTCSSTAAREPTEDKLIVLQSSWVWRKTTRWMRSMALLPAASRRLPATEDAERWTNRWMDLLWSQNKIKSHSSPVPCEIAFWLALWQMWHFGNQFQAGVPVFICHQDPHLQYWC